MRLHFDIVGQLEDTGAKVISITEDFGQGRGRRIGRTITAMINEEQALDASILTRKSRGEDSNLRSAYLKMFINEVNVSDQEIVISGPVSALENGVTIGLPVKEGTVPNFDREWCPEEDSNLHALASAST